MLIQQEASRQKWQPLSLRRNVIWALTGNVVYATSQWVVIAAIAKLGTPVMVGQFSLALAITAPVFMLAALSLRSVQAADATRDYQFRDYLILRMLTTCIALATVTAILLISNYAGDVVLVCACVATAKAFESMSDVCYGLMQQRERMDSIAHSLILRGGVTLLIVVSLLLVTGSLVTAVVGLMAAWVAVFILHDAPKVFALLSDCLPNSIARTGSWKTQAIRIRRLAALTFPLGLVMMLISLNANIPRYFIENSLGQEALGYYSAIAYLTVAATTMVSSLGQAAMPQLAQRYAFGPPSSFAMLLGKLTALATIIGICGWAAAVLFGDTILTVLYTSEYAAHTGLFRFVMVVTVIALISSVMGYAMTAMRRFRVQLPVFIAVSIVNCIFCYMLIPAMGLEGAVWALMAAAIVQFFSSVWVVSSAYRHPPPAALHT